MNIPIPETCEENAQLQTKILLDILEREKAIAKLLGAMDNASPYVGS